MNPNDRPWQGLAMLAALATGAAGPAQAGAGDPEPLTGMLGDLVPGTTGSAPSAYVRLGAQVCFGADDGVLGRELWCSDGTPAGTRLVADLYPGVIGSDPDHMVVLGDRLLFTAGRPGAGRSLWRTDGTAAGTALVFEFPPNSGDPGPKVVMNGVAYFAATGVSTGRELWRSNGTATGTWRVRDIRPGAASSAPIRLTVIGTLLYFVADDGAHGDELWRSNGSEGGTLRLTDIWPGTGHSYPRFLVEQGPRLFFVADDPSNGEQIWRTEGDVASTVRVTTIAGLRPTNLARLGNNTLLFSGVTGGLGREPHRLVNLQLTGIVQLAADIGAGSAGSDPGPFTVHDGIAHFAATTASHGRELWRSDGTPSGTWLLADLVPGPGDGEPSCLARFNDRLYFHSAMPRTLWQSDGSTPGTRQLASPSRRACGFTPLGARLLYRAEQYLPAQTGVEPWVLFDDALFGNGFQ